MVSSTSSSRRTDLTVIECARCQRPLCLSSSKSVSHHVKAIYLGFPHLVSLACCPLAGHPRRMVAQGCPCHCSSGTHRCLWEVQRTGAAALTGRAHSTCHSCSSPLLGTARSFTDIDSDSYPLCQEREDICTISSLRLSTLGTAVLSSSPAELLVQLMLDCSSHVSVSLISSLLLRQIYMSQSSAPTLYTDF